MNLDTDKVEVARCHELITLDNYTWVARPQSYVPGDPVAFGHSEAEAIGVLLGMIQARIDLLAWGNRQSHLL